MRSDKDFRKVFTGISEMSDVEIASLIVYNCRKGKDTIGKNRQDVLKWLRGILEVGFRGSGVTGIAKNIEYSVKFQNVLVKGICRKGQQFCFILSCILMYR